jgi:hypothetical protein
MRWRLILALGVAVSRPCLAMDAPTPRPLEGEPPAAATPADDEPARTLPPSVAVCLEPGGTRCWTAPLAEHCARDGGRVYRVVLGDAGGRDAQTALVQCRASAERGRPAR